MSINHEILFGSLENEAKITSKRRFLSPIFVAKRLIYPKFTQQLSSWHFPQVPQIFRDSLIINVAKESTLAYFLLRVIK